MIEGGEGSRRTRIIQIAVVLVVIGGIVAFSQFAPDISLQSALDTIASKLGKLTYLFVGLAAFLETGAFIGLVAPGETVVLLAGAVAGQGETSVVLTIGIVWVCSFSGDSVSFLLGRRLGRGFILRHGPKVRITEERFARVEDYFSRHGGKTILIGRFIGLVRALAPFIAGSSEMRYSNFLPFSVLGTGLWSAGYVLLGYFASRSLDAAAHAAGQGTLFFGIAIAVIV
ncbi:MAG TPA: DedA family protein, partial [Solirubrobacterales bacterium]|nr:DedA family protein [Solirubrobacterales bacterium]